jgi:hypothetical protein
VHSIKSRALLAAASICALAFNLSAGNGAPSRSGRDTAAQASIRKTFAEYRQALSDGDGAKAADLVSAQTIGYYGEIVDHALNMPRQKLARLDFISKFMVLRIRHEFDQAQIEAMNGRQLLILGVDKGWISKASVAEVDQLSDIKVDGHRASASIPQASGIPLFYFLNESAWKLDLVASFQLGNDAIGQEVKKSGLTEEAFIVRALNILSTKKVDERIFSGPLQ